MKVGIYVILAPDGKLYVGQSYDLKKRERDYQLHHCQNQPILYASVFKHGFQHHTFMVLAVTENNLSKKELTALENHHIERFKRLGFELLNGTKGRPKKLK